MAFLIAADLNAVILPQELNEVTRGDSAMVTAALDAAVEEMKAFLHDSYDVDDVFGKTGNDRHALLVRYGCDIAVYFLIARNQAGQELEDRRDRFDRAIRWLKEVQKSETYSSLARRAETAQKHISHGSNPKRGNYF